MTQITWIPGAGAPTTVRGVPASATTGNAQLLPIWAPDIQYLPTTTYAEFNAIITNVNATSVFLLTPGEIRELHVRAWRKHGGRQYVAFDGETSADTQITMTYAAVNELLRT